MCTTVLQRWKLLPSKVIALRTEVEEQLEIKRRELSELQEQVKPSPVRARYEADVARLRKEISSHTVARTHAEREGTAHSKRLLRVRDAALEQAAERGLDGPLVWASGEGWHPGVVGIVASRLKEATNRPATYNDGWHTTSSMQGVGLYSGLWLVEL